MKNKLNEKKKIIKKIISIIQEIKDATLLNFPDRNKSYKLYTDASDVALGAILKQEDKVIGIYSYKLKKAELNYSVMKKEALGILKATLQFKNIIFDSPIKIYIDNQNIIHSSDLSKRVQRWFIILNELNITMTHIEGKENKIADGISRLYNIEKIKNQHPLTTIENGTNDYEWLIKNTKNGYIQELLKSLAQ